MKVRIYKGRLDEIIKQIKEDIKNGKDLVSDTKQKRQLHIH